MIFPCLYVQHCNRKLGKFGIQVYRGITNVALHESCKMEESSLHKELRGDSTPSVNTRLISTWLWNREYSGIKVLHMISSQEVLKGLFETCVLGEIEGTSIATIAP